MALIVVNLTDTFEDWRTKTNTSISQIGDLASLTASNSASIVSALNGMLEEVKDDTSPELGGDLDVNGNTLAISESKGSNLTVYQDRAAYRICDIIEDLISYFKRGWFSWPQNFVNIIDCFFF